MKTRRKSSHNHLIQELRKSLELEQRETGDGESEPHTPPSERSIDDIRETADSIEPLSNLTQVSLNIDLFSILIFVLAASTRFYNLSHPQSIVFDELHYGKYSSLYLKRVFFFDPQPPLGKQLIAASAALFDPQYNGTFKFDRIGSNYPSWVPVFGLRFVPALTGSLVPSVSYALAKQLNLSTPFAILSALLLIFDNAVLIQSRYILMEMPMILFGLVSIYFALKFKENSNLLMTIFSAFFATLSLSVKYIGSFYACLSVLIMVHHFWTKILPQKDLTNAFLLRKLSSIYIIFFSTAFLTYIAIFFVHLNVLINAGPMDSVMTSAFQASLNGGLASIIKGQPVEVCSGSQITLRHALGRPCWLHSHPHNYPIKYTDGRGSSHQQQVTCYSFKDVNNWWIVRRPNANSIVVNETKDVIMSGETIHLIHGITGRLLNSHDVAAPQSPQNQEVSCYIDHNVSMSAEPLWRVEINGCGGESCAWHAVKSMIRLVHVSTGQALRMSGKQLPKWGFNQHEVVTDRTIVQDDTIWNVEEHRYTKSDKEREKELLEAEMIPTEKTSLGFWSKFIELQWKMLSSSSSTASETHAYSSFPSEWILLSRGIAYWIGNGSNAQIFFLGNPLLWLTGTLFLFINISILITYSILRRRLLHVISEDAWEILTFQFGFLLSGYLLTYIYHFCVDRTLFLHHYLPAYIFKIMLLTATLDHMYTLSKKRVFRPVFIFVLSLWCLGTIYSFYKFLPLSYGEPALTKSQLEDLRWRSSWDFIIQSNF